MAVFEPLSGYILRNILFLDILIKDIPYFQSFMGILFIEQESFFGHSVYIFFEVFHCYIQIIYEVYIKDLQRLKDLARWFHG